ncbi:MAG: hypothetical protein IT342_26165, partial [Candidatus Melainabacteria bacterium]|nr:hypothetical protein [Candidatus Melainabacteria bacterium]
AHIEKTKSSDEAIKFAQAVEKEIAAQLRQDDLIANTGAGKFIVYLPETARIESTMVMERLSRQICKKNSKRSCAQQISLSFQLLPAETAADENLQNEEEQRLNQWLSRYKSVSVAPMASFGQTISARDLWKDSRKVSIKRFDFQSKVTQTIKKNIIEILLTIQENGLALMPRLFDFHISDNYLCLVMDPHSDCPAEQFTSLKSIHPLLISVCDLFLQLDSFSIAAPVISTSKFKISHGDHETVLDSLDAHLIDALLSKPADEQTACTKAVDSFSNLIDELSEKVGTDDCFSESQKHLKNITSRKNFGSHLQKLRAILKRHEERLRRIEAIGLEGGK